ncbi:hypothetical protein R5R35_014478 [Gryllus longicercus]
MHAGASRQQRGGRSAARFPEEEKDAAFWRAGAQQRLRDARQRQPNTRRAKNLIMFLGDGMSIPTLAAARTYQGQLQGQPGEESQLFFETFPYAGLSKTYCVDAQVADSACSATAYLCGVKGNIATIGVTASVVESDCKASQDKSTHVTSMMHWAQEVGKATGIVTTTRVTHASPAGAYAHTADRDWESDRDVIKDKLNPNDCPDIAQQLITGETGKNFKVILGGGRREFIPEDDEDEEGVLGKRKDGRNLIEEWQKDKQARGAQHRYVWDLDGLRCVDFKDNEYLLGLFESSHMMYHLDALQAPYNETEPTLTDMVRAAITTLQRHSEGFVLFVEGGRIDQGHHETWAHKALDETVQLAEAVRAAADLTDEQDTLIVVTADHAHTMSINGYPDRGNDIFGIAGLADDGFPYSTLSYANGPGYRPEEDGHRHDLGEDNMADKDFEYPALAPRGSETHGGDDVAVLSRGPWAHLLTGVFEQNYIAHVMAYAACIGSGATACEDAGAARRH